MSQPVVIPESVLILKDRLKHGENVIGILESQMDTAQQNILLLQGQVRLANETIANLKKHFKETENVLNRLFENDDSKSSDTSSIIKSRLQDKRCKNGDIKDQYYQEKPCDSSVKSPYSQQLRQVLDVLQDEDVLKSTNNISEVERNCDEFKLEGYPSAGYNSGNERSSKNEEGSIVSHRQTNNNHDNTTINNSSDSNNSSIYNSRHNSPVQDGGHCIVVSRSSSFDDHVSNNRNNEMTSTRRKYSPVTVESVRDQSISPQHQQQQQQQQQQHQKTYVRSREQKEEPGSINALHAMVQSISPLSSERKRSYAESKLREENKTTKEYMKQKNTSVAPYGSKKMNSEQKLFKEFAKRHTVSYNPRLDLDIQVVPPPMLAENLFKKNHYENKSLIVDSAYTYDTPHLNFSPDEHEMETKKEMVEVAMNEEAEIVDVSFHQ